MKISKVIQQALKIYAAITFLSLPFHYMYPTKTPIFNYSATRFAIDSLNNKNLVYLAISLVIILLLVFTSRGVKFMGIWVPVFCCLFFIADIVFVIIGATSILHYLSIVFDIAFITLFVIYFINSIKKSIAKGKR